jgi:heat shock protein HslJ
MEKPTISFNLASNKLSGNTSCNGFSSSFTIDGNHIKFADALKTMMFCEGGGAEAFLKMLKEVNKYALSDDYILTFMIEDIAVMRFTKRK